MAKRKEAAGEAGERFEDVLAALEKAVGDLEGGSLGVDDALVRYEEGVRHLRRCQEILRRAEQRVEQLLREADGSVSAKPFAAAEPPAKPGAPPAVSPVEPPDGEGR